MVCPTKVRLLDELAEATAGFFGVTSELVNIAGTDDRVSFRALYERAQEERQTCARARQKLEQHLIQHRCRAG